MAGNVKDIDRGFKKLKRDLGVADGSFTKVGVQQGAQHEDEDGKLSDMVLIAGVNEFGTKDGKIPARPALRNSIDNNKAKIENTQVRLLNGVMSGRLSVQNALSALGEYQQNLMQKSITSLRNPPNAETTKLKKKSSNPLVDTGFYQSRSIQHIEVIK